MKALLIKIWRLCFFLNFFLTLLFFWPFFKILFSSPKFYPAALSLQRFWAAWLLFWAGIRKKISFEEKLGSGPYIYIANHASALDILLMYGLVAENFHFVAKKEHADTPLFGIMFSKTHIPIRRESMTDSFKAMQRAASDLRSGISIIIFPEGTMNNEPDCLLPFKTGAFKLAIDTEVPIVPVTFPDNYRLLPRLYNLFYAKGGPGTAKIIVNKPINPKGLNANELCEIVKKEIEGNL